MTEPWTPGPWEWRDYDAKPDVQQALFGASDTSETVLFHQARWGVSRADARLIAAAPEMAAALESLTWAAVKYYGPDLAGSDDEIRDATQAARALLARIRGEA